jgi:tetratricopeptide (TPR) repeat protein
MGCDIAQIGELLRVEGHPLPTELENIRDCLRKGRAGEAKALAVRFTQANAGNADGWIQLGRAYAQLSDFARALSCAQRALALVPSHPVALLVSIEGRLGCGQINEALAVAETLEHDWKTEAGVILQVGYCYTRTNRHKDALRCYERVLMLQPGNNAVLHNLAGACVALGDLNRAERLYDELLRKEPGAYETYYTRATLRRLTVERNHIADLERVLASLKKGTPAEVAVCYALAKELEDLGEWARSFEFLQRGARARQKLAVYDINADLAAMDDIKRHFDKPACGQAGAGYEDESPIFVLGMPRTGTTLIDRILSSHSQVGSIGESDEFFRALVRHAHGQGDKLNLARARPLSWTDIGSDFCHAASGILPDRPRRLDKTLTNFLYVGPILLALPKARIIHVRRRAIDTCYAIYKTLFRQGFEYSYDLSDLGRYYLGYKALVEHWNEALAGRFLTVDYEDLVANQEPISRHIVSGCGLDWEDACLNFDKNPGPALTASAAQVRNPIYSTSVGLWRHYQAELEPLVRVLRQGGIECD